MAEPIACYFDFISPYALPGIVAMERVAAKHGRTLELHPMMLGISVGKVMGLPALVDTPLKGDYLMMDVPRAYQFHGVPYNPAVPRFMTSPLVPARLFCWMLSIDRSWAEKAAMAMLRANWSEGSDVSKPENALPHVVAAGFDLEKAKAALADQTVKDDLKQRTEASIALGVFGSPTFVVDGEMFWGSDRSHIIDRWLETGGW